MLEFFRGPIKTIISHGDVDGIASAAIALRRFPEAEVFFAEPYTLSDVLYSAVKPILVLDIACKPGEGVYVIDHHIVDAPSNTFIMKDWPEATDFLVRLGLAADRRTEVTDPAVKVKATLLGDAIGLRPDDVEFRKTLVKILSSGREELPEEVYVRATAYREEFSKRLAYARSLVREFGQSAMVVYVDIGKGFAGKLASVMGNDYRTFVLVWKNDCKTIVTVRGENAKAIVEFFKNVDVKFCSGGGHDMAASFSTDRSPASVAKDLTILLSTLFSRLAEAVTR